MELSIIILNYNTPIHTLNCIKSLYKYYNEELKSHKYELILIDNKSTDNSVNKIEKEIKKRNWKILFVKSDKNTGFGVGCNIGAKKSKGRYLLFLNSDTIVFDKSLVNMLAFISNNSNVSILGSGLVYKDGTIQGACGVSPNFYHSIMILAGLGKNILVRYPNTTKKVDWVLGACMLIRKKVFKKLKGFDRNIFMYYEEVELCRRAIESGYQVYHYPTSKIIHLEGKSSSSSFRLAQTYKGYLYYYKKHKNILEYLFIKLLFSIKFKIYYYYGRLINNIELMNIYSQM